MNAMKTTLRFCFALALALLLTAPAGAAPVSWSAPARLASQAWSWLLHFHGQSRRLHQSDGSHLRKCGATPRRIIAVASIRTEAPARAWRKPRWIKAVASIPTVSAAPATEGGDGDRALPGHERPGVGAHVFTHDVRECETKSSEDDRRRTRERDPDPRESYGASRGARRRRRGSGACWFTCSAAPGAARSEQTTTRRSIAPFAAPSGGPRSWRANGRLQTGRGGPPAGAVVPQPDGGGSGGRSGVSRGRRACWR